MSKKFLKSEWVMWVLILAPAIFGVINWNVFPQSIATHWNLKGEVDSYSGKWAVFLGPLMASAIYLLLLVLPKIDPRKKNYDLFTGAYWVIRMGIMLVLFVIGMTTSLFALGYNINVEMMSILTVLGLFLLIGNQFGKIRPNYFVGIRTPWALNNEQVWMKTHRLAGKIWVGGTLLMLLFVWFIPMKTFAVLFIPYVLIITIIPVVYSYYVHKKTSPQ